MTKGIMSLLLGISTALLTGCAGVSPAVYGGGSPVGGWIYTGVTVPSVRLHAPLDETAKSVRTGTASAVNIMGILGVGDAGIDSAMKSGNITKIHHIDHKVTSVLGIYSKWTVMVHGE